MLKESSLCSLSNAQKCRYIDIVPFRCPGLDYLYAGLQSSYAQDLGSAGVQHGFYGTFINGLGACVGICGAVVSVTLLPVSAVPISHHSSIFQPCCPLPNPYRFVCTFYLCTILITHAQPSLTEKFSKVEPHSCRSPMRTILLTVIPLTGTVGLISRFGNFYKGMKIVMTSAKPRS